MIGNNPSKKDSEDSEVVKEVQALVRIDDRLAQCPNETLGAQLFKLLPRLCLLTNMEALRPTLLKTFSSLLKRVKNLQDLELPTVDLLLMVRKENLPFACNFALAFLDLAMERVGGGSPALCRAILNALAEWPAFTTQSNTLLLYLLKTVPHLRVAMSAWRAEDQPHSAAVTAVQELVGEYLLDISLAQTEVKTTDSVGSIQAGLSSIRIGRLAVKRAWTADDLKRTKLAVLQHVLILPATDTLLPPFVASIALALSSDRDSAVAGEAGFKVSGLKSNLSAEKDGAAVLELLAALLLVGSGVGGGAGIGTGAEQRTPLRVETKHAILKWMARELPTLLPRIGPQVQRLLVASSCGVVDQGGPSSPKTLALVLALADKLCEHIDDATLPLAVPVFALAVLRSMQGAGASVGGVGVRAAAYTLLERCARRQPVATIGSVSSADGTGVVLASALFQRLDDEEHASLPLLLAALDALRCALQLSLSQSASAGDASTSAMGVAVVGSSSSSVLDSTLLRARASASPKTRLAAMQWSQAVYGRCSERALEALVLLADDPNESVAAEAATAFRALRGLSSSFSSSAASASSSELTHSARNCFLGSLLAAGGKAIPRATLQLLLLVERSLGLGLGSEAGGGLPAVFSRVLEVAASAARARNATLLRAALRLLLSVASACKEGLFVASPSSSSPPGAGASSAMSRSLRDASGDLMEWLEMLVLHQSRAAAAASSSSSLAVQQSAINEAEADPGAAEATVVVDFDLTIGRLLGLGCSDGDLPHALGLLASLTKRLRLVPQLTACLAELLLAVRRRHEQEQGQGQGQERGGWGRLEQNLRRRLLRQVSLVLAPFASLSAAPTSAPDPAPASVSASASAPRAGTDGGDAKADALLLVLRSVEGAVAAGALGLASPFSSQATDSVSILGSSAAADEDEAEKDEGEGDGGAGVVGTLLSLALGEIPSRPAVRAASLSLLSHFCTAPIPAPGPGSASDGSGAVAPMLWSFLVENASPGSGSSTGTWAVGDTVLRFSVAESLVRLASCSSLLSTLSPPSASASASPSALDELSALPLPLQQLLRKALVVASAPAGSRSGEKATTAALLLVLFTWESARAHEVAGAVPGAETALQKENAAATGVGAEGERKRKRESKQSSSPWSPAAVLRLTQCLLSLLKEPDAFTQDASAAALGHAHALGATLARSDPTWGEASSPQGPASATTASGGAWQGQRDLAQLVSDEVMAALLRERRTPQPAGFSDAPSSSSSAPTTAASAAADAEADEEQRRRQREASMAPVDPLASAVAAAAAELGLSPQALAQAQAQAQALAQGGLESVPGGSTIRTRDDGSYGVYAAACRVAKKTGSSAIVMGVLALIRRDPSFGVGETSALRRRYQPPGVAIDGARLKALLPTLFMAKFDPQPAVRSVMRQLWTDLVGDNPDHLALLNAPPMQRQVLAHCLAHLSSVQWREREAACFALEAWLPSKPFASTLLPVLEDLWQSAVRVMDDVRDSARVAAVALLKVVTEAVLRAVSPTDSPPHTVDSCLGIMLPLLLDKGLVSPTPEGKGLALGVLVRLIKAAAHSSLRPWLVRAVSVLVEAMSALEPRTLQYMQFHTQRLNISDDELSALRVRLAAESPMQEALDGCLAAITSENVTDTAVALCGQLSRGVGLATRVAACKSLSQLAERFPREMGLGSYSRRAFSALLDSILSSSGVATPLRSTLLSGLSALGGVVDANELHSALHSLVQRYLDARERQETHLGIVLAQCVQQLVARCGERLVDDALLVSLLATAHIGSHDPDTEAAAPWREVWAEVVQLTGAGTKTAAVAKMLPVSCRLLKVFLCDLQWSRRSQALAALNDALSCSSQPALVAAMDAALPAALLRLVPGQIWSGQGAVLEALAALMTKMPSRICLDLVGEEVLVARGGGLLLNDLCLSSSSSSCASSSAVFFSSDASVDAGVGAGGGVAGEAMAGTGAGTGAWRLGRNKERDNARLEAQALAETDLPARPVLTPVLLAAPAPAQGTGQEVGSSDANWKFSWRGVVRLLLHEAGRGDKLYKLSAAHALASLPWATVRTNASAAGTAGGDAALGLFDEHVELLLTSIGVGSVPSPPSSSSSASASAAAAAAAAALAAAAAAAVKPSTSRKATSSLSLFGTRYGHSSSLPSSSAGTGRGRGGKIGGTAAVDQDQPIEEVAGPVGEAGTEVNVEGAESEERDVEPESFPETEADPSASQRTALLTSPDPAFRVKLVETLALALACDGPEQGRLGSVHLSKAKRAALEKPVLSWVTAACARRGGVESSEPWAVRVAAFKLLSSLREPSEPSDESYSASFLAAALDCVEAGAADSKTKVRVAALQALRAVIEHPACGLALTQPATGATLTTAPSGAGSGWGPRLRLLLKAATEGAQPETLQAVQAASAALADATRRRLGLGLA